MSYIRNGYVFVSQNKKVGRKGYGCVGQCVFIIGSAKKTVSLNNIVFPQIYWDKRIRFKIEILTETNGMPKGEDQKLYSIKDMLLIKEKSYQDGYGKGYRKGLRRIK